MDWWWVSALSYWGIRCEYLGQVPEMGLSRRGTLGVQGRGCGERRAILS